MNQLTQFLAALRKCTAK